MKKLRNLVPVLLLLAVVLSACGQSPEKLNSTGNDAFDVQDYEGALTAYNQALDDSPELAEPHYNAANTHYRLEDYGSAQQEIEQALINGEGKDLTDLDQRSLYNLGNTFFQAEQYEGAIEAYKEALRLNPDDLEAKQNLELALRQLQQQEQQQQEEQQENEEQEEQNEEQQDQQQQQDGEQDEEQQDDQQQDGQQDEQQEEQQDGQQDQEQQDAQQDEQQQDGQPDEQQEGQADGQPQQQETGLTEEQAKQLLEAAAEGTESLEEYLQLIYGNPQSPPAEDW
jgi:Ca-activated chloride channel family protein